MRLRAEQKEIVDRVYDYIRQGIKRIVVIAGTGCGKTVISSHIMRDAALKGRMPGKVLFLVDLDCLLDQTGEKLGNFGVKYTIIQGNRKVDWKAPVMIASRQTLQAWQRAGKDIYATLGALRLIVADECHDTAYSEVYADLERHYQPTGTVFLGLTATPWRRKRSEYLGQWYDASVEAPQPPELIKKKAIVRSTEFSLQSGLDQAGISGDDFSPAKMSKLAREEGMLSKVVDEYRRLCGSRSAVAYCADIKHAKALNQTFLAAGIPSEVQVGETRKRERDAQNDRLDSGTTRVLCTVGTATKGWDLPSLGAVLMVRATLSKGLFFQCAGRGCRPHSAPYWNDGNPKRDYLLLDFGGNLERHGSPSDYQDYSISPNPKSGRAGMVQDKPCPVCGQLNRVFARLCSKCEYEFSSPQLELGIDTSIIQLAPHFSPSEVLKVRAFRAKLQIAYRSNKAPSEVIHEWAERHEFLPPDTWFHGAIFGDNPTELDRATYREYLNRCVKPQWIEKYFNLEFPDQHPKQRRKRA